MGLLAESLLHGHGLSSPFGPPTGPSAMVAPAYPLLVAGVFYFLGSASLSSALFLIGLNIAMNLLTVSLILALGRQLAGERVARWAAIFWACSPPLLWMPTIFWETNLSGLLLLAFVAGAFTAPAEPKRWVWGAAGVFCGAAGLLNPALLPSLFVIAIVALHRTSATRLVGVLLAIAGFVLVFAAWPVRNAKVFHAWVPTRTTIGLELWMGNHPGSTGYLDQTLFPSNNPAELADYEKEGEIGYTRHKAALARTYIEAHPGVFAALTLRRCLRFWSGAGNSSGSSIFVLHAVLTTSLGAFGLVVLFLSGQSRRAWLLLTPLVLFPLPYYITHAEFRYRLVLDPVLTILSAVALQQLVAVSKGSTASPPGECSPGAA